MNEARLRSLVPAVEPQMHLHGRLLGPHRVLGLGRRADVAPALQELTAKCTRPLSQSPMFWTFWWVPRARRGPVRHKGDEVAEDAASGPGCVQCGLGGVSARHRCVTSSPELHTHLLWRCFRGQELRHGLVGSPALGSLADRHRDVSRGWGLSRGPDRAGVRLQARSVADGSIQLLELLTGGPSSSLAPSGPCHWASLWPAAQQLASSEQSKSEGEGRRTRGRKRDRGSVPEVTPAALPASVR